MSRSNHFSVVCAEGLGTLILLATVVGSGIMADTLSPDNTGVALLANAIATGAILYVLITVLGPVSGAHFNPAVTMTFFIRGDITKRDALTYAIVQVAGGILGVWLAHAMFDHAIIDWGTTTRTGPGQWLSEGVATFGLVFVILGGLARAPAHVPSLVALYITAAYWFTASTSFANPAVTIARSFTSTFAGIDPMHAPGFIFAQFLGAALALWISRVIFRD